MKLNSLLEMALKRLTYVGNFNKTLSGFDEADMKYLTHNIDKITQRLALGPDVEVFIMHDPDLASIAELYPEGEIIVNADMQPIAFKQAVGGLSRYEIGIILKTTAHTIASIGELKRDRIYFIMGDNYAGDESPAPKIVPTGWIIMHRLLHALNLIETNKNISDCLSLLRNLASFHFKAAKIKNINPLELEIDIMTELLLTGKLRATLYPSKSQEDLDGVIQSLTMHLRDAVDKCKGRIFYI